MTIEKLLRLFRVGIGAALDQKAHPIVVLRLNRRKSSVIANARIGRNSLVASFEIGGSGRNTRHSPLLTD
jgi:hypothetical protein